MAKHVIIKLITDSKINTVLERPSSPEVAAEPQQKFPGHGISGEKQTLALHVLGAAESSFTVVSAS